MGKNKDKITAIDDGQVTDPLHFFPQAVPLWAVEARTGDRPQWRVGMIIGWAEAEDDVPMPVAVEIGPPVGRPDLTPLNRFGADWFSGGDGVSWVVVVEFYLSMDEARERGPALLADAQEMVKQQPAYA